MSPFGTIRSEMGMLMKVMKSFKSKCKTLLAVMLVFSFIFPRQIVWCESIKEDTVSKIDAALLEKMKSGDADQLYTVWITLKEPDYKEASALASKEADKAYEDAYGQKDDSVEASGRWQSLYEYFFNEIQITLYEDLNKTMSEELELEAMEQIPGFILEPMMDARLAKEDIYRIADNEKVIRISCYDASVVTNNEEYVVIEYTPENALHILKALVGLEVASLNLYYDVNNDQEIDTCDALYALQASVQMYAISWPAGKTFVE